MGRVDHLFDTEEDYVEWFISELSPEDAKWQREELRRTGGMKDEHGVVGDGLDTVRSLREWAVALSWPGLDLDECADTVHDFVTELLKHPKSLYDLGTLMAVSAFQDFQIETELGGEEK